MKLNFALVLSLVVAVGIVALFFTLYQISSERDELHGELEVRTGAIAYQILARAIKHGHTTHARLSEVLHKSGPKELISTVLYVLSVPLAFVEPMISCAIFVVVAIIWVVPDPDIEKALAERD